MMNPIDNILQSEIEFIDKEIDNTFKFEHGKAKYDKLINLLYIQVHAQTADLKFIIANKLE